MLTSPCSFDGRIESQQVGLFSYRMDDIQSLLDLIGFFRKGVDTAGRVLDLLGQLVHRALGTANGFTTLTGHAVGVRGRALNLIGIAGNLLDGRCHFIDRRGNLVSLGALFLNRGPGFIRDPAELFRRGRHLIRGGANFSHGVLNLHNKGIETTTELGQLVGTLIRQPLAEIALTISNFLHHVADVLQRPGHATANEYADHQSDYDNHNRHQKDKAQGLRHARFNVLASSSDLPVNIGNVDTSTDHPVPVRDNGGIGHLGFFIAGGRVHPVIAVEALTAGSGEQIGHQPPDNRILGRSFFGRVRGIGQVVYIPGIGEHVVRLIKTDRAQARRCRLLRFRLRHRWVILGLQNHGLCGINEIL